MSSEAVHSHQHFSSALEYISEASLLFVLSLQVCFKSVLNLTEEKTPVENVPRKLINSHHLSKVPEHTELSQSFSAESRDFES